jgi:hypothetical protein
MIRLIRVVFVDVGNFDAAATGQDDESIDPGRAMPGRTTRLRAICPATKVLVGTKLIGAEAKRRIAWWDAHGASSARARPYQRPCRHYCPSSVAVGRRKRVLPTRIALRPIHASLAIDRSIDAHASLMTGGPACPPRRRRRMFDFMGMDYWRKKASKHPPKSTATGRSASIQTENGWGGGGRNGEKLGWRTVPGFHGAGRQPTCCRLRFHRQPPPSSSSKRSRRLSPVAAVFFYSKDSAMVQGVVSLVCKAQKFRDLAGRQDQTRAIPHSARVFDFLGRVRTTQAALDRLDRSLRSIGSKRHQGIGDAAIGRLADREG